MILWFERCFSKPDSAIHLKWKIFAPKFFDPPKLFGLATPLSRNRQKCIIRLDCLVKSLSQLSVIRGETQQKSGFLNQAFHWNGELLTCANTEAVTTYWETIISRWVCRISNNFRFRKIIPCTDGAKYLARWPRKQEMNACPLKSQTWIYYLICAKSWFSALYLWSGVEGPRKNMSS